MHITVLFRLGHRLRPLHLDNIRGRRTGKIGVCNKDLRQVIKCDEIQVAIFALFERVRTTQRLGVTRRTEFEVDRFVVFLDGGLQ